MLAISSTESLTAELADASSTDQPEFIATHFDVTSSGDSLSSTKGELNGTTPVTVVSGPSSGSRGVHSIMLANIDDVEHTVILKVTGGTTRTVYRTSVPAGGYVDLLDPSTLHTLYQPILAEGEFVDGDKTALDAAILSTDGDVSGASWVLDEDDMASDSATKVPTQQSVKKYVDDNVGGNPTTVGARDLSGFPNRTDTTLSIDGSGNFTIAPTGASFVVWNNGTSYTKTSEGVQVTADNDETYIYYDAGVLTKSTTVWDITDGAALVAIVFKTGSSYAPWDERHAHDRDRNWHEWAHRTIGARYQSGFAGVFDNTTLSVAQGTFYDEDIDHVVSGTETDCRLWYRNTGAGSMTFESGVTTPYKAIAGALQYDLNGTITPVTNNQYSSQWVYASPDPDYPFYVVVGQSQSNTLAGARSQSAPVLPGLATAEWKLLYQVIYRNAGGTPTYIEAIDYRQVSTGPATTATVASHTALTDRDAADSHPATAISVDTTNFDNNLSSADDTVQKALETLDEMTAGGGTSYPADGRLTLESGVPISTTDQSAKTTLYYTPYVGDQIAVYDGSSAWSNLTFTETSLSLAGLTADKNYDIFGYDNSGTFALESLVWTDDTTRATALTRQNGVLVKTGATTRRYLGTIRINSTGGQCEDTETQRFAWNMYNRVNRRLYLAEETSHTYSTGTWRDWNNSELAVEIVSGFDTVAICSLSPQFNGTAVGVHYGSISGSTNLISQLAGVNYTGFRSSVSHNYVLPTGYSKLLIGENLSGLSSRVFFDANQRI